MNQEKVFKKVPTIQTSFCRTCAYFIIYSFLGFIIETLFALINYGVLESRQGFLYGPFCCIYGLGAVVIILSLRTSFSKNNYTLFLGGFFIGSIVEYLISFLGELILNVKWWDYSNSFLNINGRICFMYSIFWGFLGLYLMKSINPQIDKFINWLKNKKNITILKTITYLIMLFLLLDCIISAYAINVFLIKVTIEMNLPVTNKQKIEYAYSLIYNNSSQSKFIYKHFDTNKMLLIYPNLTIELEDGSYKKIKDYYPNVKNYYYKFNNNLQKIIQ